ncbi:hypothetical protein GCM10007977_091380 [Dactylosporangium sucinum]|uniref:Uncharacterized protein n=1 Tax=Dactylosporangium sucinum TaxID=1424081 RepID=A0A917UED9_9ACTN|nr:hypothetical protein GCM10007977_091380 [Dactylosporangium sucinum]
MDGDGVEPGVEVVGGLAAQHPSRHFHALEIGPRHEALPERRPVAVSDPKAAHEVVEHGRMQIVAPDFAERDEHGEERELHDSKIRR